MTPFVAPMEAHHIKGVVALQRDCFPAPFPEEYLWLPAHLERHLQVFPEGQFVALLGGNVVGSASATRISESKWLEHRNWEETVVGFVLETFEPTGNTLYGLDISVHPEHRGRSIGRSLYEARYDLVRRLGLTRYGTACRLPGFLAHRSGHVNASVQEYAEQVVAGEIQDRTLTPLLRYGLRFLCVLDDYMEDHESANSAALLEWTP